MAAGSERPPKLRRMSEHVEADAQNEEGEEEVPEEDVLADDAALDPPSDDGADAETLPRHSDPEP